MSCRRYFGKQGLSFGPVLLDFATFPCIALVSKINFEKGVKPTFLYFLKQIV